MEYIETESSNIKKVGYDAENSILEIWFHSGGKYWYFEFSEEDWKSLVETINLSSIGTVDMKSTGKYFHRAIKGKFSYLNITHFEQDVEFDAIIIQNRNKLGTERDYLKFSLLCKKHDWDKTIFRSVWFDLQSQEYKNAVHGTVGDLDVEEENNE